MPRTDLMQERKKKPRRRSRRVIKPIPILVFWQGNSGKYEADICDLGMGGCFINTNADAKDGESIKLDIPTATANENTIRFTGTVIPQGRTYKGFGVRFDALNEEQQSLVARLMARSPEQPDNRLDNS